MPVPQEAGESGRFVASTSSRPCRVAFRVSGGWTHSFQLPAQSPRNDSAWPHSVRSSREEAESPHPSLSPLPTA